MKNKTIAQLLYRFLIKDFDSKLESADATYKMIMASTHGKISHFYNDKGEKIRGYHKHSRNVVKVLPTNSLIVKYGN
jgi:hypothetical protein